MLLGYLIDLTFVKKSSYSLNDPRLYNKTFCKKKKKKIDPYLSNDPGIFNRSLLSKKKKKKFAYLLNDPRIYDRTFNQIFPLVYLITFACTIGPFYNVWYFIFINSI